MSIKLKSPDELLKMHDANQCVADVLDQLGEMIAPGVSTHDLDLRARSLTKEMGLTSAFLGYGSPPFSGAICASINDVIVHGIPSKKDILANGDIISIDYGAFRDGYCGDSARTFAVGDVSENASHLMSTTAASLDAAIEACVINNRISDVSAAVQRVVESAGLFIVRQFCGHGIGSSMHEDPQVPNYVERGKNPRMKAGLVIAIEPMVNQFSIGVKIDDDQWTARTTDGGLSAHFEHSVAITEYGPWALSSRSPAPF